LGVQGLSACPRSNNWLIVPTVLNIVESTGLMEKNIPWNDFMELVSTYQCKSGTPTSSAAQWLLDPPVPERSWRLGTCHTWRPLEGTSW